MSVFAMEILPSEIMEQNFDTLPTKRTLYHRILTSMKKKVETLITELEFYTEDLLELHDIINIVYDESQEYGRIEDDQKAYHLSNKIDKMIEYIQERVQYYTKIKNSK